MYNLPVKHQHSSLMPTRPSELLHWKTITGILMYTRDRGAISSSSTPRKLVPLIDTRCDLLREYEIHNHHGLLNSFPPITAMAGQVKIKSAITELVDPRQQHSPAYNLICGDPMVKITLGIRPDVVQLADRSYMGLCHSMTRNVQLVAIGPIGIDLEINHVLIEKQVKIFKEFVYMANVTGKPLRIYHTKNSDISFDLAEKGLPRGHPVHLVNFIGDNQEALRFKQVFENGYLGISSIACNPPPYYVDAIRVFCIDRMVLESNAPYSKAGPNQGSHPTDIAKILVAVANIKEINVNIVAKYFRRNTCALYRY